MNNLRGQIDALLSSGYVLVPVVQMPPISQITSHQALHTSQIHPNDPLCVMGAASAGTQSLPLMMQAVTRPFALQIRTIHSDDRVSSTETSPNEGSSSMQMSPLPGAVSWSEMAASLKLKPEVKRPNNAEYLSLHSLVIQSFFIARIV